MSTPLGLYPQCQKSCVCLITLLCLLACLEHDTHTDLSGYFARETQSFDEACEAVDTYPNATVAEYGTVSGEDDMMAEIFARGPIACEIDADPLHDYTVSATVCAIDTYYQGLCHSAIVRRPGEPGGWASCFP